MMMAPEKEEETIKKSAEEHRELGGFGGGSLSKLITLVEPFPSQQPQATSSSVERGQNSSQSSLSRWKTYDYSNCSQKYFSKNN